MSKVQIKSIFDQIASEVFNMKDVNQAKQFITEFVSNKNIKDEDKKVIIDNVNNCKSISRIQTYICNSLLRYEGMSVNK
jgi:F0F1-type ATP synthase delta subunit